MLVDSHCHLDRLDLTNYHSDLQQALVKAAECDVQYFLCPAIDLEHFPDVLQIAQEHKNVVVSAGLHPSENIQYQLQVDELCKLADNPLVVAIGETGLDYHYAANEEERANQRQRFITHIRAARTLQKPLIIHSRSAASDIIDILRSEQAQAVGGIMHCFAEDLATAEQVMNLNFYIGLSGIITFKNADSLRQIAKQVPQDRILLETDAPYLAPVPYRGKPNEPAYLRNTAEALAKLRDISYNEVARITTENFFRLFPKRVSNTCL